MTLSEFMEDLEGCRNLLRKISDLNLQHIRDAREKGQSDINDIKTFLEDINSKIERELFK